MISLAAWLGLRDPNRDTLEPNPEKDVDLYVDLDGLVEQSLARFAARAPKLVVWGDYGTGKTHLLHVLMSRLDPDRFQPVYVKLDAHGRVAESRHLHDAILSRLEALNLLAPAIGQPPDGLDKDVAHAFELLRKDPRDPDARAWLLARGPSPAHARRAGFSSRLSDVARGKSYADIWRALGESFRAVTGRELILFIDETETFQEIVDPARASDLGVALREMFDAPNKAYGAVLGLTATRTQGDDLSGHPLMRRPDVASRAQSSMVRIQGLQTEDRRERFVTNLLDRLLTDRSRFLSEDAMRELVVRGPDLIKARAHLKRDPVQREFVKHLDELARVAHGQGYKLPLSTVALVGPT